MADTLKPGTEQDGFRFVGGDPSNQQNWEPVGLKVGAVEDGFQFMGGDPSNQKNWKKADRSYLGAAAESGGRTLLAAGARIVDELNPFTLSEQDAAVLYKNDPEGFKRVTEQSASMALSRYANEQTRLAKQAMTQVAADQKGAISDKPLGELEYATTDPSKAAYLSPTRVAGDVLQSLPSTIALGVSAFLTKGSSTRAAAQAEANALAKGATAAEAKAAAQAAAIEQGARTMATTGAVGEGAVGFGQQMNETRSEAMEIKPEVVEQSPEYQALIAQGYDPEVARRKLVAEAAKNAGLIAGAVDATTNLVGGRVLGKVIGEGGKLGARTAKGVATESATEIVQSGGEQVGSNYAQQILDPNIDLTKNVGEAMAAGGVVGGVTGGATAAAFGSPQRQATQKLDQAKSAGEAIAAADELAGSVQELAGNLDQMLAPTGVQTPSTPAAAPVQTLSTPAMPGSPELRDMVDRDAALMQQASTAGFEADRQNALAQAESNRGEPRPRTTENLVDLTPMDPRQAQARLAVLRDQTAQEGGNALELVITPHPSQPGKLAIGKQSLPDLSLGATQPTITPQEAQNRLETASLTGKVQAFKQEDRDSRQVVIDRALRNVEARGGVASPAEARIFQEANLGKPYDRIDETLAPALTPDQKLTQATGIALDQAPRSQETQQTGPTEQQLLQEENNARSDSRLAQIARERAAATQAEDTRGVAQAPAVDDVIAAMRTPGANRSAEQNLTIRQAQDRMAPGDFEIAQTAAAGPFKLSAEQRVRLRDLRATPTESVVNTQQPRENPYENNLMGERVRAALGQPSNGTVITTGAKFSTERSPVPGMTGTVNDTEELTDENGNAVLDENGEPKTKEVEHQYTVVEASKLGNTGRLLQQVARIFGKRLVVFKSDTLKADGFVRDEDNRNIYLNASSGISPLAVFGHELLHLMKRENAQAYQALVTVVQRNLDEAGKAKFDKYYGKGANIEELTADLMGNQFQDPAFWSEVFGEIAAQNPEGARGIVLKVAASMNRAINAFMNVVKQGGFKSDEFVSDLQAIKAAVKEATVSYAQTQRGEAQALARDEQDRNSIPTPAGETITQSKRRADFENPEDRTEVSTTSPKPAPAKGRLSNSYDEKWIIDGQDVRASEKHIAAILKALKSYNTLSGKGNAAKLMQELHDVVVENLLWLHDLVPAEARERAKLWYDGANRIATDWTAKYGVSLRQASGVLAVLSPQMDWFKNVSLGERVTAIWKQRQNEAWSPAMTAWAESWVNASKDVDTKASRQAVLDEMRPLQGVKLSDMNMRQAALFVRAFDEAYFERQYRLVTPEGGFGDYVTNSDEGDASVTWGGFDTIEKAISVLNDGSFKNIDQQLGSEHKVRNFYNNIISPNSADGHVTIDTHAVAAALVKGLSGTSREVEDNFGKAGGNVETGAGGTYALFADAYRDAAAKRGILPREMQSITWEAVRALFPAALKDKLAPQVDAVWNRFKKGEITREQARDEVKQLAGGIRKMAWEGSDEGTPPSAGGTSFRQELDEDPAKRQARTLAPELAKDKVSISLSASTSSIPGIAELQAAASKGDGMAHALLQDIALDNLRHLLAGTSARVRADGATGLYGGAVESSLSATVSFADNDRAQVLAALAKFAENFNQEQVHVRRGTSKKAGHQFGDGSYATPVFRWNLKSALSRKQIEKVISDSGLYGLTFGDSFVEAYYVGDPKDAEAIEQFKRNIAAADQSVGSRAAGLDSSVAQLWPYGQGAGTIGYERIRGDISVGSGVRSETAKRVAQYLNSGAKVKAFDQAPEITPEQSALQGEIAQVYESLPDNDLKNPNVRKAYNELAREVLRQFKALPIKVEVMNGQGEPYANSTAMRRDILDNNHLFIFGTTPETFGPPGADFSGHPLLENTGLKDQNGYELLYNDLLRAVHGYYAHAMSPTQFGPKGEEAAWKNHMSMTSNVWARWALTAETRGQNSWVNFRKGAQNLPIGDREFARQKAVLLPVKYSLTGDRTVDKPMKDFIAKLGERVQQGTKPAMRGPGATLSRQREALSEYAEIEARYKGTDQWLKAPNGQDTKLTERQWVQVRTPSFKSWFGDWEKYAGMQGGVWNDDKGEVSKVVDANGEPLVVYHGTNKGGFSVFNRPGGSGRGDLGIFLTPDLEMAKTYMTRRGGEVEIENDPLRPRQPSRQERNPGYYSSFVNLRNPAESDFEGATWGGERPGQYIVLDEDGVAMSTPSGQMYFNDIGEAERAMGAYGGSEIDDAPDHFETTDGVAREARRDNFDGAIVRNVIDSGSGMQNMYAGEPADVFIAFEPNQLKSATQNTGEFSAENDDIRYSKQRIVGESKRAYTPEQLVMFKNTGRTVDVPTIKERIAELKKDLGKKLAQGIADQFRPLKDLSKEAYALARLSKGAAGAFEAFLHHGRLSIRDNVYDADTSGGFIERLGVPLHGELEDFMWWVAANRAARLKAEGRENLFSDADIAAGKSLDSGTTEYDYTIQYGPEKGKVTRDRTKIYRDAQVVFNEFHKNALDMAEQSGLIDPESRKYWENDFYVPFYRVSEEEGGFIGAKIGQSLVRQRAFQKLKGGTDKLNSDLLANTLQNWGHLIDAAAKNRAAKAALEAAQNVGIAIESSEESSRAMAKSMGLKNHVVWFMDEGKARYFVVEDPMVMQAITSLEFAGLRGPLMDALSKFKHWLTIGVTASPAFKIRNLVRDSMQAVATADLSYNIAGNLRQGFAATKRDSQGYVTMLASGALIRFGTMEGSKADQTRRLIKKGVKESTILDTAEKMSAMYAKYIEPGISAYNELGNRGEEITRAALYTQLTAKGMGHQEASLMARDLMDFSMQGTFTTIRFLTQVVPFMNARIQGLYKLGRAANEDRARFAIVLGAVAMASIALMAAYQDDDDWKKREDWDRNNNWWFKVGGVAFRIPKPFEIGAIATMAERGIEYFTNPEMTGKRLGKNYWDILKDNLSMNPVPQAVKPIIDLYSNKDSFSGRPIETMGMEKLKSQYRYTQSTSMVARGLSTATAGALSPVQFDHVMRGYFGWLGSFVVGGADMVVRPLTGEASRPQADYWKMATAGIAAEVESGSSRYVSQMYEQAKVLEEAYGTYRSLLKEGKVAEAKEFFEDNKESLLKYKSVEKVKAAEAKFNERIRMIERSAMDPAEKKTKIREIQVQKDRVARLVAPGLR